MTQGSQSSREFRNKSRTFLELCSQFERKDLKKEIEQAIQLMTQAHSEADQATALRLYSKANDCFHDANKKVS